MSEIDVASKVPKEVVIMRFGNVMSCSPGIFRQKISDMAKHYDVPEDALSLYIAKVLKEQPVDEDFMS